MSTELLEQLPDEADWAIPPGTPWWPEGYQLPSWWSPERPTGGPMLEVFCALYVRQTKGRWRGEPLALEEFQRQFIFEALEADPVTGLRLYAEVLLGLPRKNGKSTLASAVALFLLLADGEASPEVYAAAGAKDQAGIVFRQTSAYVQRSPALLELVKVRRWHLECPGNDGVFRALSSDAPLQHGLNPSGNIIDELWAHKDPELYVALTSAGGAREQPLTVTITTAGWDEESLLGQLFTHATGHPEVEHPSPYLTVLRDKANGFLFWWYGLPPEADADDMAQVKACNPASWITTRYLTRERWKPGVRPSDFVRLHGNRWTPAEEPWLPHGTWPALIRRNEAGQQLEVAIDPALPVAVAVDMGQVHDSTGVALAQRRGEECFLVSWGWENPYPLNHPLHDTWTMGEKQEELLELLRAIREAYPEAMAYKPDSKPPAPAPGPAFAYDPWQFEPLAVQLREQGMNMVEFPQRMERMVPASELLYELATTRRLVVGPDPVLARHVSNAVAQLTPRGWRIAKGKVQTKRVDRAVSAAMAVWQAWQEPPKVRARRKRIGRGM